MDLIAGFSVQMDSLQATPTVEDEIKEFECMS